MGQGTVSQNCRDNIYREKNRNVDRKKCCADNCLVSAFTSKASDNIFVPSMIQETVVDRYGYQGTQK